jgi:hypothetical protein
MANSSPNTNGLNRNGRPRGSRNKNIIEREFEAKARVVAVARGLTSQSITKMKPLEIMLAIMHACIASGDLMAAVSVAEKAAPYCHPKFGAAAPEQLLPLELMADPPPTPDEPGPDKPIL